MSEKRRYQVTGFKEIPNSADLRVLLQSADLVTMDQEKKPGFKDMMKDPMKFARNLGSQQLQQMIHDTFKISRETYLDREYDIGDYVIVTIEKE